VEGHARNGELSALQKAFIDHFAFQCGYCTAGFLNEGQVLLERLAKTPVDGAELENTIAEALDGHLCRCTGYIKYHEAVRDVILADPKRYFVANKRPDIGSRRQRRPKCRGACPSHRRGHAGGLGLGTRLRPRPRARHPERSWRAGRSLDQKRRGVSGEMNTQPQSWRGFCSLIAIENPNSATLLFSLEGSECSLRGEIPRAN
jgi:hypothetical protein